MAQMVQWLIRPWVCPIFANNYKYSLQPNSRALLPYYVLLKFVSASIVINIYQIMSNATELNKLKDFVIKLNRKGDGKSFVWDYFGTLYDITKNAVHDETRVYCKACLEDNKQRPSLKAYKFNVATGNLAIHLRDVHQIQAKAPVSLKSQQLISSVF